MSRGDPNAGGNHRKSLVQSLGGGLKRLTIDYMDLNWVHAWNPLTSLEFFKYYFSHMLNEDDVLASKIYMLVMDINYNHFIC